jgi:uncharacterized protein YjbI with pentapeptide repeats
LLLETADCRPAAGELLFVVKEATRLSGFGLAGSVLAGCDLAAFKFAGCAFLDCAFLDWDLLDRGLSGCDLADRGFFGWASDFCGVIPIPRKRAILMSAGHCPRRCG